MQRVLSKWTVCALAVLAVSHSVRADEASDLQQLKDEVAAERKALADERASLAEQRRRIDEALLSLQDQKADTPAPVAREVAMVTSTPPVAAPAAEKQALAGAYLDVYGFIQADAIYDFNRVDPAWNATLRVSKIPVTCPTDPGCGQDGETVMSVRQSRLGFRGVVPTSLGDLKTQFEFDLYGVGVDAGNTTMRIRHIWGELGQWGAGQTNSLFTDADLFPNIVDYWGPPGMAFLRNPQVRWTPVQDENWKFAVALEASGAGIDAGRASEVDPALSARNWNKYPDLTSQLSFSNAWGRAQFATILRSIGIEGTLGNGDLFHRRRVGWGLEAGDVLQLGNFSESLRGDQLIGGIVYGYGIANYMNDAGVDIAPDAGLDATAVPTLGWIVYYNRTWNEYWTSSVGYSQHRQFNVGGQEASAFKQADYMSVNLLWHPLPDMFVGPEFLWGRRKNEDSNAGSDSRIQVSFHYNFGGRIAR
jgi:outer membrane DcaP-like protein